MYELPVINSQLTKTQLKIISEDCVEKITQENRQIESMEAFSKMEFLIKEIKANPDYIESLRDEVAKHGKSVTTTTGTKIELAEVGVTYNYDSCGDYMLSRFEHDLFLLEEKVKARKEFLKNLPEDGMEIIHEDEVIRVYPPIKTSKSSVKTTISK